MQAMRRQKQQLTEAVCQEVMERNTHGVMGVMGVDGYPYTVPLSYVWLDGAVYFHCAKEGHKLEALRACDKVSFTVVDQDVIVGPEYTTYFRSVILFGRGEIVEDPQERQKAFWALAEKYSPKEGAERHRATIERSGMRAQIVKIQVEHMSGKEAIELAQSREQGEV